MYRTYQPRRLRLTASATELLLVILVGGVLWHVSPSRLESTTIANTFEHWQQTSPITLPARADWLSAYSGPALAFLGLTGWAAISLGRLNLALSTRLAAILSIWVFAAWLLTAGAVRIPLAASTFSIVASCLAGAGLSWSIFCIWRQSRNRSGTPTRLAIEPLSIWVYPGWLLFGGLGTLWLLDYAAHGYPKHRNIGVYQFDHWFLATALFTLVAASAPSILAGMSRRLGHIESGKDKGLILILGILGAWLSGVTITALPIPLAERPVALITEVLRMPAWLGMAWFTYRWVGTGLRPATGLLAAGGLLLALLTALWVLKDRGPILVQAIAISLILGSLVAAPLRQRSLPLAATLAALAVVIAAIAAISWGVYRFGSEGRNEAPEHPYQGPLEYLSENHWFIHASPTLGFGLGNVPWCGHAGSLGLAGCAGVPQQIQSDYVFVALSGVWGTLPATLLIILLLAWLSLLIHARFNQASARAVDLNTLAGWFIAAGALTYATQVIVSSLGSLGVIPLTGVSIPLLAYGGTSLFTLALLAGLAINRFPSSTH